LIAGNTEQRYINYAHRLNLRNLVKFKGQVSFELAVSILKGSSAVLYIGGRRDDYHFPSKILVYAAAGRPIIGIKQSDFDLGAYFIERNNLGMVIENRKDKIITAIDDLFNLWQAEQLEYAFGKISKDEYYWETRAGELERFLSDTI
jgi:glycosyltransferase involved in cell wall biosynthesis